MSPFASLRGTGRRLLLGQHGVPIVLTDPALNVPVTVTAIVTPEEDRELMVGNQLQLRRVRTIKFASAEAEGGTALAKREWKATVDGVVYVLHDRMEAPPGEHKFQLLRAERRDSAGLNR